MSADAFRTEDFQIYRLALSGSEIRLPPREPRRDWIYSRDVALGVLRLLDAEALQHDVYNLASGFVSQRLGEQWCERLRTIFPALTYRLCESGEEPNVEFLGALDRAMMSTDRMVKEIGFTPAYRAGAAFDDYISWLQNNGRLYE